VKFIPTPIDGLVLIEVDRLADDRGFFARTWCSEEFERNGLNPRLAQCNISFNTRRGTVRGMHFQAEPKPEAKLVRCTRGAIHDVVIDLRPSSRTYRQSASFPLDEVNRTMLYIGAGLAHGFQTLVDETEVFYQMSESYVAELARGVRWNDPAFDVRWPIEISTIAERDLAYPDFLAEGGTYPG
jgi:dTDP-4-dehydrorhamnose 3,5-epimerase